MYNSVDMVLLSNRLYLNRHFRSLNDERFGVAQYLCLIHTSHTTDTLEAEHLENSFTVLLLDGCTYAGCVSKNRL